MGIKDFVDPLSIARLVLPVPSIYAMVNMDEPLPEMIDNPIQSMFIRHQQRFIQSGGKRISYPREYKIAAIDRVKAGNTRYKVAKCNGGP